MKENEKSCIVTVEFKSNNEPFVKEISANEAIELIRDLRVALKQVAENA